MRPIVRKFADLVNIPHLPGDQVRRVSDQELELFAELIVKKCADIAINAATDTNFASGISLPDRQAISIGWQIRQYFGLP